MSTPKNHRTSAFILLSILILLLSILTLKLQKQANIIENSEENRYKSVLLADWLKQSSDDLTRYCRTYIVTKDSIWEKRYWDVVNIRNGLKPWPNGNLISLRDSMSKLGFIENDFELLTVAENNSNKLIWTERVAFNTIKGLFADSTKQFTIKGEPDEEFAKQIMFDKDYHNNKESIMIPISEFVKNIDQRTLSKIEEEKNSLTKLVAITIALLIFIIAIAAYLIFVIQRRLNIEVSESKKAKVTAEGVAEKLNRYGYRNALNPSIE